MTTSQLASLIGKRGTWKAPNGLIIAVIVDDARTAFGRVDLSIRPEAGAGHAWINADSLVTDRN